MRMGVPTIESFFRRAPGPARERVLFLCGGALRRLFAGRGPHVPGAGAATGQSSVGPAPVYPVVPGGLDPRRPGTDHGVPQGPIYDRFQTATLLETGDGDYYLYLWPGDTLAPDALYHFARAAAGGADLIYGDEDFLYPHPPCCRLPFFKSAPSLITQSSFDMLSCGVAVHRNLLKQVGSMAGASAEARYAFNLKALAASRRAVHIPRPLYTLFQDRRPGPSAVALLETALGGQERVACGQWPGSFRVWAPVGNKPSFSIVIPNRNNCAGLRRLLESLEAYTVLPPCAIRIVDLGSRDATTLRYYQLLKRTGRRRSSFLERATFPGA